MISCRVQCLIGVEAYSRFRARYRGSCGLASKLVLIMPVAELSENMPFEWCSMWLSAEWSASSFGSLKDSSTHRSGWHSS